MFRQILEYIVNSADPDDIKNNISVEYIESEGTQYIDTGINAGPNIIPALKFKSYNDYNNITYGCIFGARVQSQTDDYQLTTFVSDNTANYQGTLRWGNGAGVNAKLNYYGSNTDYIIASGTLTPSSTNFRLKVDSYKIGGSSNSQQTDTLSRKNRDINYTITIFALNSSNTIVQFGSLKLYYIDFKMQENYNTEGQYIKRFNPVYNKVYKEYGLYENIEGKFYRNLGTGRFNGPSIS